MDCEYPHSHIGICFPPGATTGGVVGPVVRITVVRMENITTGIALDSPTPCQRCPTSQLMGDFRFQIFSYLDSRAPGGIYYTSSYCASTTFWGGCNYEYQYFGGGGGGIGN